MKGRIVPVKALNRMISQHGFNPVALVNQLHMNVLGHPDARKAVEHAHEDRSHRIDASSAFHFPRNGRAEMAELVDQPQTPSPRVRVPLRLPLVGFSGGNVHFPRRPTPVQGLRATRATRLPSTPPDVIVLDTGEPRSHLGRLRLGGHQESRGFPQPYSGAPASARFGGSPLRTERGLLLPRWLPPQRHCRRY